MSIERINVFIDCCSKNSLFELEQYTFVFLQELHQYCAQQGAKIAFNIYCFDVSRCLPENFKNRCENFLQHDAHVDIYLDDPFTVFGKFEQETKNIKSIFLESGDFCSVQETAKIMLRPICGLVMADRTYLDSDILAPHFNESMVNLTQAQFSPIAIDYLHPLEIEISKPCYKGSDSRIASLSWYLAGQVFIKYSAKPFIVAAESPQFLGSTEGFGEDLSDAGWLVVFNAKKKNDKIFDINGESTTLFKRALHLSGRNIELMGFGLENPLIAKKNENHTLLIAEASKFSKSLLDWVVALKSIDLVSQEERPMNIRMKYEKLFSLSMSRVEKRLKELEQTYSGKTIVFYGMGEFGLFISKFFKFSSISIVFSDRNYQDLRDSYVGYPVVAPENILNWSATIVLLSINFRKEMNTYLSTILGQHLNIVSIPWEELIDESDLSD